MWIYEYCHLKSASQVSVMKRNGSHEDYSLGKRNPFKDNLVLASELNYIEAKFMDGDLCEPTNSPRESSIRFVCGSDSTTMSLMHVFERSICNYVLIVHVPLLCSYFPIYQQDLTRNEVVDCFDPHFLSGRQDPEAERNDGAIDSISQVLQMIKSQYKDAPIVKQYKNVLEMAVNNLNSSELSSSMQEALEKLLRTAAGSEEQHAPQDPEQPDEEKNPSK